MARENNEGGVVWLSFPYAGVKMEAVVALKMSDCSMSEETPQKMNETVKNNSKSTKMPQVIFYDLFPPELLKIKKPKHENHRFIWIKSLFSGDPAAKPARLVTRVLCVSPPVKPPLLCGL